MRALADRLGGKNLVSPDGSEQRCVIVIGAGITGLVAAYELRRRGVDVMVYEASRQSGGSIRTTQSNGFVAEHGANSLQLTPAIAHLVDQLGLSRELIEPNSCGSRQLIARDGRLQPMPHSLRSMLTSRLLSLGGKARLLCEPFALRDDLEIDESVASFVERRCGREVLDYIVDPLVRFQCGGDVEDLSVSQLFPRERRMELEHGSIGRALLAARRNARRNQRDGDGVSSTDAAAASPMRVVSFRDGLQAFPRALERSLTGVIKLNCPARLMHRDDSRWAVEMDCDGSTRAQLVDAVVLATPAHVLAAMELPAEIRRFAAPIEHIEHPPVSTLTLGFRREQIAHALDAGAILVPSLVSPSLLGVQLCSSTFPGRAPAEHVTLTCMLGGALSPDVALLETDVLTQHALEQLQKVLPVVGEPVFRKRVFWPHGMPQYTTNHGEITRAADTTELMNPGLYLAGNYRSGSSIGACVESGQHVAQRVATYLARAG
jgi:oxygen-dependent protoporphyrinogen oxidase